jgi:hypothetical protein
VRAVQTAVDVDVVHDVVEDDADALRVRVVDDPAQVVLGAEPRLDARAW